MNDEPQIPADAALHRLLTTAMGPNPLNDEEIESLLNSAEPPMPLGVEQTQRIVGKVHRLLSAAPKAAVNNVGLMLPNNQRPQLVSATTIEPARPIRIPAIAALVASMLALVSVIVLTPEAPSRSQISQLDQQSKTAALVLQRDLKTGFSGRMAPRYWMTAKPLPDAVPTAKVAVGDEIATGDQERRRVTLPDGSVLYVNSGSQVKIATERRVEVTKGKVFVEVVPAFGNVPHHSLAGSLAAEHRGTLPFEVVTPNRTVTALGTKFSVSVDDSETDVMVTQGKVRVSGVDAVVSAGQQIRAAGEYTFASASPISAQLEWTRDLLAAATGPLVPKSEYSGGALVTVDPNGQSARLSLRNYHIDVHIEDGFARTTIDQTYFNHTHTRLEGTFHFPLPTDASLSRLAMYVNGKLMEGGMAERDHARNTFEEIKRKMLDPALLEWVDGSTFKMRVFPLEPRQEKRIVLSYSQRLNSAGGQLQYRFPAGHTMDAVRDWSAHVRIKDGAGSEWHSQSHTMTASEDTGDLVLDARLKNALMDRDLVLRITENTNLKSQIANFKSDAQQYLMLRLKPDLPGELQRQPHHWVFLFEHAGDRSPLLARAQIEIMRTLLDNAEHSDTFSIVGASTRAELYPAERQLCTAENIAAAVKHLENIHLVGALDLAAAFRKCAEQVALPHLLDNGLVPRTRILVHLGSGLPALGERDASKLAAMIPAEAQYVGIGVGRRWNQAMMKQAASRTGGLSTQINPDEEIAWRAFDVFSKLHSPRLVNVAVASRDFNSQIPNLKSEGQDGLGSPSYDGPQFLLFSDTIAQGEEFAAICRVPEGQPLPASVTVTATLNGQPWTQTIRVANVKNLARYLPRHWAKLEIDRLLAENAEQHRDAIVALSKSMYVMSPFTSLLVLENEEMYTQFNIDRGRKDHWAMYPCPEKIEVVSEVDLSERNVAEIQLSELELSTVTWILQALFESKGTLAPTITGVPGLNRIRFEGNPVQVEQFRKVLSQLGEQGQIDVESSVAAKTGQDVLSTILRLQRPQWFSWKQPTTWTRYGRLPTTWQSNGNANWHQFPYYSVRGVNDFGLVQQGQADTFWGWQQRDLSWDASEADNGIDGEPKGTWIDKLPALPSITFLGDTNGSHASQLGRSTADFVSPDFAWHVNTTDEEKFQRLLAFNEVARQRETDSFTRQLNDVDLASIMPAGEYNHPDAKSWKELVERRKNYDRVNNRVLTASERQIESSLSQKVSLHFHDAPLASVIRHIANEHGISIAIKTKAIEMKGPAVNPIVNIDVDGITLKSSLNLLLDQAGGLAYSIENDMLMITTEEEQKAMRNGGQAVSDVESFWAWRMQDLGLILLTGNEPDVGRIRAIIGFSDSSIEMQQPVLLDRLQINPGDLADAKQISRRRDRFSGSQLWRRQYIEMSQLMGETRSAVPRDTETVATNESFKTHRWVDDAVGSDVAIVALPTFQTPSRLEVNAVLFGDLICHAPGLNTSPVDVMAVVEAESVAKISNLKSQISNPPAGRIDDAARALIEKSRARGWESITLPGRDGEAGITVHYDGAGRHVWERIVSEGLREHVVCDRSTLWHVYREIGLASKRPFSRFHHREFTAIVPWLLPDADELARGANVVAVDERTIAIVPVSGTALAAGEDQSREREFGKPRTGNNNSKSEISNTESIEQTPAAGAVPLTLHLVFAPDGRLAERRFVEHASGKILHSITYDADGTVRILDADGKDLATLNLHRSTAAAPQLVPDLNGLVVLPMPVRTPEVIVAKESAATGTTDLGQVGVLDADLSEDDAVSLILASMANGNGARMVEIARKRFIDKGDTRGGIYVLLSRFPQALVQAAIPADATPGSVQTPGFDLRPPVEGSPLKQFVRQYMNSLRDGDDAHEFRIDAPEGSFLQRLATARNLYVRWLTETATKDLTQAQVQQEVDRTLEFIASCRTLDMGWSLMSVMRPRLTTPEFLAAYAKASERFEQHPQIGLMVRRERMTALFAAGKYDEGRSLFKEWLMANLEQGFVPPIGPELYNACISNNGLKQIDELLLECAKRLVDAHMLMTSHSMSVQIRELGNINIADQMMTLLLASLDAKERPDVSLCVIQQLRRVKDPRADKLLDQVMELPMADQVPGLWRFASKLAEDSGRKRLAAERLERAIQLEFATRPTVINIQTVRTDYTELLAKYEELITASTTLELAPPADLGARIVQATDQWRTLDEDDTAACQTASRLLAKLNSKELAWDYLTTPLAENSGESAPWIALARNLGTDIQTDLAGMAWMQAFELESTNPEILLEHARMLQAAGRFEPAKVLLKRAADGTWQPRFASAVQQCRDLLRSF